MLINGQFQPYEFDYLGGQYEKARLEKTLPQGQKTKPPKGMPGKLHYALEAMSKKPFTLAPTDMISDALKILRKHKIHHIPVIDNENLVGMLSDRDLLKVEDNTLWNLMEIKDVMSSIVLAVHQETELGQIARVLLRENISALPVLDDSHKLVGILSRVDILKMVIYHRFAD